VKLRKVRAAAEREWPASVDKAVEPSLSIVEVRGVEKTFERRTGSTQALLPVNLSVGNGEFVSLVGRSGCGKTTLLRIIAGLTAADRGEVLFGGAVVRGVSDRMAYVFQDVNLLPWRSVVRNVELGLEARGLGRQDRRERALAALRLVGLEDDADRPPYTLSGGMQQRVGVARALATEPQVLLMDEPFSHLDNFTREALQGQVSHLCEELHMTVIFVTHDIDEAIYLSDRIALFRGQPGQLVDVIQVPIERPRSQERYRAEPGAVECRERVLRELGVIRERAGT
jgi:ABC-type nitrate/sulfonate/bicarbonate transport system ATPase subunit